MRIVLLALISLPVAVPPAAGVSLKAMYDAAPAAHGYDKYIELQTGVVYTGGLWIGGTFNRITAEFEIKNEDVRIAGNGAILDLKGQEICIAYTTGRFDIENCVILGGNVRYRGYDGDGAGLLPPRITQFSISNLPVV